MPQWRRVEAGAGNEAGSANCARNCSKVDGSRGRKGGREASSMAAISADSQWRLPASLRHICSSGRIACLISWRRVWTTPLPAFPFPPLRPKKPGAL